MVNWVWQIWVAEEWIIGKEMVTVSLDKSREKKKLFIVARGEY